MNISDELTVDVWPTDYSAGTAGVNMYVYTAEKNFFGNWVGADFVCSGPSNNHFAKKWKHTGKIQGLYFRNYSGDRWTGKFNLYW